MLLRRMMTLRGAIAVAALVGVAVLPVQAELTTYHIGNSLTWDARITFQPELSAQRGIDHEVGFHISNAKTLDHLVNNPDDTTLDPAKHGVTFGAWDAELATNPWDVVTMQLHPGAGSTLSTDVNAAISLIDEAQKHAANADTRFMIYGAWPDWDGDYADRWLQNIDETNDELSTRHSRAYHRLVFDQVRQARPDANIELLQTGELMYQVDQQIKSAVDVGEDWLGFTNVDQLYRNGPHLDHESGRWLAMLAMWSAMTGEDPTEVDPPSFWSDPPDWLGPTRITTDPQYRDALSQFVSDQMGQVHLLPEPGAGAMLLIGTTLLMRRRWR